MLLELAVADAYGAGFEGAPEAFVRRHNALTQYVPHPWHGHAPGCYTDDTQMSLAIAEAVLSGAEWTPSMLAAKFVQAFKRDERRGYAKRFFGLLQDVNDGGQLLARIEPDSAKSGAAMRATPIGVFPTVDEVTEKATAQAAITHDTPGGRNSACAAALSAHYFLYGLGPRKELGAFLEAHLPGPWGAPWQGPVDVDGVHCVRAAVTAILAHDTLSGILRAAVAFTGDTDTVAAIAVGAAANSPEIARDLPQQLIDDLENGEYGRDYLMELDRRLEQAQARMAM
jgi:ADP-ribosylglycohydrolase